MSLNKIKINQLDFDVGEISLAASSGFFITSGQLVSVSGSLKDDLNNTGIYFKNLSGQVSQFSGDFNNFSSRNFVYGTGDQTITGIKTFRSQPNFQGTGFVYKSETGNFLLSGDLRLLPQERLILVTGAGTNSVNGLYYNTLTQFNGKNDWRGIGSNGFEDSEKRIVFQPSLGWCIETLFSPGGFQTRYRQGTPSVSTLVPDSPAQVTSFLNIGMTFPGNSPNPTIYYTSDTYYNSTNKDIRYFKFVSGTNNSLSINFAGGDWATNSFLESNKKINFRGIDGTAALLEDNIVFRTGDQTLSGIKDFTNRPTFSGARILVNGDNDIVYTTGNQNIGGLKNFTGERIQISGSGILHSGEVALRVHTHPISGIINLENELSGKLSNIQLPNKTVITNSTPIVFDSYRNAILDYEINHGGISTIYLPRTGVAGAPRNGDQILIQVSTNLPSVSPTKIQTGIGGAGTPSYGDFYTFDNGVGGVSLFYTNDRWNLRSILTAHSQTHAIGGNDRIFPLNIGAAPRQDFASFEWTGRSVAYLNGFIFDSGVIPGSQTAGNINSGSYRPSGSHFYGLSHTYTGSGGIAFGRPPITINSFAVYGGYGNISGSGSTNYIPFNRTGFNTNTGIFELVNPSSLNSRIYIKTSGIYEIVSQIHLYDMSSNIDAVMELVRSQVITGAMPVLTAMSDDRFAESSSDRIINTTYMFQETSSTGAYYNVHMNFLNSTTNPFPSSERNAPTRVFIKKLM